MTPTLVPLPDGSVTSPQGFTAAAAHAGLKPDGAPDVALLVSSASCATAGVFTKNAVRAAPVLYDADLLGERPGRMRAVAMNARVANACTGAAGLAAAPAMAPVAGQAAGLPPPHAPGPPARGHRRRPRHTGAAVAARAADGPRGTWSGEGGRRGAGPSRWASAAAGGEGPSWRGSPGGGAAGGRGGGKAGAAWRGRRW